MRPPPTVARSWLQAKEIPFAFTLMLSALGWCIVHVIDEVQGAPTLAYRQSTGLEKDGSKRTTFEVTNISHKQLFRHVSFYIASKDGHLNWKGYLKCRMDPEPPARVVADDNEPPKIEDNITRFYVGQFHPGTSWKFSVFFPPDKVQPVVLTADFSSPETSEATIEPVALRLVREGVESFLVRHQIDVLVSAIAVWLLLVLLYLAKVPKVI
jgi:hypothetical protein